MDDDDQQPVFKIKKRSNKPSASLSRSSSSISLNSPAKLSFAQDDDADPAAEEEGAGNVPVIRSRGKKTPAGRVREREGGAAGGGKPKSRLSFGGAAEDDEEDDDSAVVKRSTPSSTPRRALLRATLPPSSSSASISTDAGAVAASPVASAASGSYSKDYLESLKREQRATPRVAIETSGEGAGGYDSLTRSKFGDEQMQDESFIPTTDAIARAKARREELRKSGAAVPAAGSDYVSLDVGFASKGGDSRLVREEDEIGDGDEDLAAFTDSLTSLPLGKKANKAAALKMRQEMGEMIDDVGMEVEEEDDEQREWEAAQIRRAGGDGETRRRREPASNERDGKKTYRAAPIPQSAPLPSLASALSRLTASLSDLQTSHASDASALAHFAREREDLDRQEKELREEVEKTEKKGKWFEEMKGEVETWAAFLEEKFPALEAIESESLALLRERYRIIASRRFQDASDDVALFTGQPVSSRFPPRPLPSDDFQDERMDEDVTGEQESEEDLAPRSAARNARRAEREQHLLSPSSASTDALSPSAASDLRAALTTLHTLLTSLFSDVRAPAFRDPNLGIRQKFEEWRELWREEYEMTYAGLGMVQVWEFWARVEVVGGWNPLEIDELPKSPSDLSSYAWHSALSSFGHDSSHADSTEDTDESTELINSLVTSVVLPRLSAIARAGYDPYSEKQTKAAVRWVDEISYCVEKSSPKFEALIHSFLHRLRLSISHLHSLLLPSSVSASLLLPSLAYDPTTFVSRTRFLSSCLPLLSACMKWRRFMRSLRVPATPVKLSEEEGGGWLEVGKGGSYDELVQRELVGRGLLPVVEAAWGTGGEEVAGKILELLPKDLPPALKRRLEGEGVRQ